MLSFDVQQPQNAGANSINSGEDHARFRDVVMPHLDAAYNLARWLTRNDSDAEDVVQEACLRAFRRIGNFSNGNARAWVLIIVRHTAYAWLGKNRPATLVVTDDLEVFERAENARCGCEAETPETTLVAKIEAAHLQAAIRRLPSPFRETLVLRDLQDLDYKEIAEVTEVPIGTVMSRLARARRRLIAIIANDDAYQFDASVAGKIASGQAN
jgi:RNA polymerase sigma factor (sigma-70 family)